MTISKEEHEARLKLYNLGYTDAKIAEARYTCSGNITKWRQRNGLKPHRKKNAGLNDIEHAKRMILYKRGLSDSDIARIVRVATHAIWHWRKKNKLKPNKKRGGYNRNGKSSCVQD